ncbi:MAG: NAD+ synthase [archaeon]
METRELNAKLVKAIKTFFAEQGKTKVVLGLSGGIDSALVLSLLCEAIGRENVSALLMPNSEITKYSSTKDAEDFAKKLGVKYLVVPVDPVILAFSGSILWNQSEIAKANLNARIRAVLLYNYANSFDALVAGTGNKSEFYLGYFTKYGDAAADFFPIGSLLKTQVRALAAYGKLPKGFLEKVPSAELWKGQEDEKELGLAYEEIDALLPLLLGEKQGKIPAGKFAQAEKIRALMNASAHKRAAAKIITL